MYCTTYPSYHSIVEYVARDYQKLRGGLFPTSVVSIKKSLRPYYLILISAKTIVKGTPLTFASGSIAV